MYNNLNKKRKTWLPIHKENWFGDWFDPHESYLRLPSFWWPFTIIMIGVVLVSWKVIDDQELVWGLDSRVEQWYEWFKIPLWVLALLIPVLGLFNANHKSEQTRASMELTKAQNNFANYYKHLEEFSKYVGIVSKDFDPYVKVSVKALHSKLFPLADQGDYQIAFGDGSVLHAAYEMVRRTIKDIQRIDRECSVAALVEPGAGVLRHQMTYGLFFKNYFVFKELIPDGVFVADNDDEGLICQVSASEVEQINRNFVMLKLLDEISLFDAKTELPYKEFHFHYKNAFDAVRANLGGAKARSYMGEL